VAGGWWMVDGGWWVGGLVGWSNQANQLLPDDWPTTATAVRGFFLLGVVSRRIRISGCSATAVSGFFLLGIVSRRIRISGCSALRAIVPLCSGS
jgi:hypothetical protein